MVIDESAEKKIISLWLFELLDPRGIEEKIGIPKSSGYRIINAFRKETPGIEDFREMWKSCKKPTLSPVDLVRMLNLVERFNGLGTSTATLIGAVSIVNEQGEQAGAAVSSALVLQDRAIKSGKSFPEVVADENRLRDSEEALKIEISALQAEKERLAQELPNLRELRDLQNKLQEKKIDTEKLDGFIDDHVEYSKNGFNREAARVISSGLGNLELDPIGGAQKIVEIISKYRDMKKSEAFFLQQEAFHQKVLLERGRELTKVKEEIAEERKRRAEISSNLQKDFDNQKKDFEIEITKLKKYKDILQSELQDLIQKRSDVEIEFAEKQHKISVGETVYSFLSNPPSTPRDKLAIVSDWINRANKEWGAGRSGDIELRFAHDNLIEILKEVVKADIYPKVAYDQLKAKCDEFEREDAKRIAIILDIKEKFERLDVDEAAAKRGNQVRDSVINDISVLAESGRENQVGDGAINYIPGRYPKKNYHEMSPPFPPTRPTGSHPMMHWINCRICQGSVAMTEKGFLRVEVSYFCKKCNNRISDSLESLYQREVQIRMKQ